MLNHGRFVVKNLNKIHQWLARCIVSGALMLVFVLTSFPSERRCAAKVDAASFDYGITARSPNSGSSSRNSSRETNEKIDDLLRTNGTTSKPAHRRSCVSFNQTIPMREGGEASTGTRIPALVVIDQNAITREGSAGVAMVHRRSGSHTHAQTSPDVQGGGPENCGRRPLRSTSLPCAATGHGRRHGCQPGSVFFHSIPLISNPESVTI